MKYILGILFIVVYVLIIHFVICRKYEQKNFNTHCDIIWVALITFGIIALEFILMRQSNHIGMLIKDIHEIKIIPSPSGIFIIDSLLLAMPFVYSFVNGKKVSRKVLGICLSLIEFILYIIFVNRLGYSM